MRQHQLIANEKEPPEGSGFGSTIGSTRNRDGLPIYGNNKRDGAAVRLVLLLSGKKSSKLFEPRSTRPIRLPSTKGFGLSEIVLMLVNWPSRKPSLVVYRQGTIESTNESKPLPRTREPGTGSCNRQQIRKGLRLATQRTWASTQTLRRQSLQ